MTEPQFYLSAGALKHLHDYAEALILTSAGAPEDDPFIRRARAIKALLIDRARLRAYVQFAAQDHESEMYGPEPRVSSYRAALKYGDDDPNVDSSPVTFGDELEAQKL